MYPGSYQEWFLSIFFGKPINRRNPFFVRKGLTSHRVKQRKTTKPSFSKTSVKVKCQKYRPKTLRREKYWWSILRNGPNPEYWLFSTVIELGCYASWCQVLWKSTTTRNFQWQFVVVKKWPFGPYFSCKYVLSRSLSINWLWFRVTFIFLNFFIRSRPFINWSNSYWSRNVTLEF